MHLRMHEMWFFLRMHVKIHEICLNINFWFCSFWKMHIRMHEIWFFAWCIHECMKFFIEYEFLKCMFECMKFDFFVFFNGAFMKEWNFWLNLNFEFEWKCMFEYIKFDSFVLLEECIYECMKVWLNMNFWFEWKCMFECMKFNFLFFLKSTFMNAWNFVNFLNENACLNAWVLFVFLILFFFFFEKYIYECVKFYEFSEWKYMLECMSYFCLFDIVLFKKKCIYECIKLDFFCFIIF